jgi:hypothetical protein
VDGMEGVVLALVVLAHVVRMRKSIKVLDRGIFLVGFFVYFLEDFRVYEFRRFFDAVVLSLL